MSTNTGLSKKAEVGVIGSALYGHYAPDGSGLGTGLLRGLGATTGSALGTLLTLAAVKHTGAKGIPAGAALLLGNLGGMAGGYYGTKALTGPTEKERKYRKDLVAALKQEAIEDGTDYEGRDYESDADRENFTDLLKGGIKTSVGGLLGGIGGAGLGAGIAYGLTGDKSDQDRLETTIASGLGGALLGGIVGNYAGLGKHIMDKREKHEKRKSKLEKAASDSDIPVDAADMAADSPDEYIQTLREILASKNIDADPIVEETEKKERENGDASSKYIVGPLGAVAGGTLGGTGGALLGAGAGAGIGALRSLLTGKDTAESTGVGGAIGALLGILGGGYAGYKLIADANTKRDMRDAVIQALEARVRQI